MAAACAPSCSGLSLLASSPASSIPVSASSSQSVKLRCPPAPAAAVRRWVVSRTAVENVGVSGFRRGSVVVGARRSGTARNGGVAEAVEEATIPDDGVPDDMYMGRKLEGLEPNFWEGEKWDTFGFLMQYLWGFGVLISLVACGIAVTSYNSGAVDIRDTAVYREAMENQVESGSSLDLDNLQDPPEMSDAPPPA